MTLDLFAIDLEDGDSLASILREDRLRCDDRRSDGDAVNSSSTFGLAFVKALFASCPVSLRLYASIYSEH